uniref:CHK kinase-like domain-containing protein n=1 Tax=Rhodnius prolixus TaxID=13249 RepID=A0A905R0L8_RHOPR
MEAQNFKVADRRNCLDLNHGLLVIKSLGRMHAMSHVLLERGSISRDDLGLNHLESDSYVSNRLIEGGVKQLAHVMENDWPSEWKTAAREIAKEAPIASEKIRKLFSDFPSDGLLVMNHGDCWTCNMMFKYSPYEKNKPIAVKFLDFQACHYNSYIFDVIHFIYRCIAPNIRRENINRLLEEYQSSLAETLTFFGLPEKAPTLEQVCNEAKRLNYLKFFLAFTSLPMSSADTNTAFYIDRLATNCDSKDVYSPEPFQANKFRLAADVDIRRWLKDGFFE